MGTCWSLWVEVPAWLGPCIPASVSPGPGAARKLGLGWLVSIYSSGGHGPIHSSVVPVVPRVLHHSDLWGLVEGTARAFQGQRDITSFRGLRQGV